MGAASRPRVHEGVPAGYAQFLGLDGRLYVDEYAARVARHEEERIVPPPLERRRGGSGLLPAVGAAVLLGGLVAGLVAWRHGGGAPEPTRPAAAAKPVRREQPAPKPVPVPVPVPKPTFAVIRAARDGSWLSVRIGGPTGREIYTGTLERGRGLRFGLARPLWVRMGRPAALDVRIGNRAVGGLPPQPANLLLTRNGAGRASLRPRCRARRRAGRSRAPRADSTRAPRA